MNGKRFLVATVFAAVLLTMAFIPISSQAGTYDPWMDIDENGKIEIKDFAQMALAYGTTGDPTKNVNVTNWPEHQSNTIIMVDNATIRFAVQDVNLGSVDVAGFGHVSLFIYYYIDGNVDLRLYPKCLGIQYNGYTAVSMHTLGTWYTGGLMAYEVSSPIINLTLHSYGATYIYLTLVLYCYN